MKKFIAFASILLVFITSSEGMAQQPEYLGFRACMKCHDAQGASWRTSAHAKSYESLKPKVKAEAKTRAKLDPAKDYTQDKNCIGCHVTGYGMPGGYNPGGSPDEMKLLVGVTCESCHGAGGKYRNLHGEASDRLKTQGMKTDRKLLVDAGQVFDMEKACVRCHLNYEGVSTTHQVNPPYSPFTPNVDAKYQFDYMKSVMTEGQNNPIHSHFKLRGVFKGDPVPSVRGKLQENAPEPDEQE